MGKNEWKWWKNSVSSDFRNSKKIAKRREKTQWNSAGCGSHTNLKSGQQPSEFSPRLTNALSATQCSPAGLTRSNASTTRPHGPGHPTSWGRGQVPLNIEYVTRLFIQEYTQNFFKDFQFFLSVVILVFLCWILKLVTFWILLENEVE